MSAAKRDGLGILGLGAAACVACCVGPILAFFGGLSLAGIASTVVVGLAGLGIAVAAAAAGGLLLARRGRVRDSSSPDPAEPVAFAPPTMKLPVR
jgi:hypothetical protein